MKILTPLLFLKIKSAELILLNWVIPTAAAFVMTWICCVVPHDLNIFGQSGLIKSINGLLAILVGFFIAALTATASFPAGGNLDRKIAGKPITITYVRSGRKEEETLSRRKFLCLLFGFNAFSSLFLYLGGEFSYLFAENVKMFLPLALIGWSKSIFLLFYFFGLTNLFLTTLLGLHYITERMHRV